MDLFCTSIKLVVHIPGFFALCMENSIEIIKSELKQPEGTVAKHLQSAF